MTGRIRPAATAGLTTLTHKLTRTPSRWLGRHGKNVGRGVVTTTAVLALTLTVGVTPSIASPALVAQRQAEKTLAEVRDAAAKTQLAPTEPAQIADPAGEGTITPDQSSTVTAQDPNVEVTFSGHEIDEKLDVDITPLPKAVATSVESETGATAVGEAVEITAVDASGAEVTTFPADGTLIDPEDGPAYQTDVVPGVALEMTVSKKQIADLDPASLKIYSREEAGDPWVELPSYYDADAGVVKGESGHLSQMVVMGTPFVAPPGPVIVIDPDDDLGHAEQPHPGAREYPLNLELAHTIEAALQTNCLATVHLTRDDPNTPSVSIETRAAIAAGYNPVATMTIGYDVAGDGDVPFDSSPEDAGSRVWARDDSASVSFSEQLKDTLTSGYTTRPARDGSLLGYPYSEFNGVSGAIVHFELRNGTSIRYTQAGGTKLEFVLGNVKVIVNESIPFKSTAYFIRCVP